MQVIIYSMFSEKQIKYILDGILDRRLLEMCPKTITYSTSD